MFHEALLRELIRQGKGAGEDSLSWLRACRGQLRELNEEHSRILANCKSSVQFPDLYAELYNL